MEDKMDPRKNVILVNDDNMNKECREVITQLKADVPITDVMPRYEGHPPEVDTEVKCAVCDKGSVWETTDKDTGKVTRYTSPMRKVSGVGQSGNYIEVMVHQCCMQTVAKHPDLRI